MPFAHWTAGKPNRGVRVWASADSFQALWERSWTPNTQRLCQTPNSILPRNCIRQEPLPFCMHLCSFFLPNSEFQNNLVTFSFQMKRQMRKPAPRTSGRKWELNLPDPWLVLVWKEQWILNHTTKSNPSTESKSLFKEREIYIYIYIA